MVNPLLRESNLPFQAIPFHEIKSSDFLPALQHVIGEAKEIIRELKENSQAVTFKNSVETLEKSGEFVGNLSNIFFALYGAESDDELREVAKVFSPMLSEFSNDILLDERIFTKVKECYENRNNFGLRPEELKLVEETYGDFIRNGALLNPDQKERLRNIDKDLAQLSLQFGDNLLKETQKYTMELSEREDLKGLPDFVVTMAAEEAKVRGLEGKYVFTLDYPSYGPFLKFSEQRNLREKLYKLSASRAYHGDEFDNQKVILNTVKLREERAKLLGFETHAHFTLQRRMAQTPEKVRTFLDQLFQAARPVALKEMKELAEYAGSSLERWDYAYYAEKLKNKKFDIDDEKLRPYFQLEKVIQGVFQVASKLYNLSFNQLSPKEAPVYHPDVKVYEVRDETKNQHIGLFYADFFPRKGKRNGAWMTPLRDQKKGEVDQRPHISIVCNFTKPTEGTPSLLSYDEVTTLFHEFGHALHGLLSDCHYTRFSGTNVYWDFVELPSQIMENWAHEKECLDLFASHYETGEKIPNHYIQKIRESLQFHEGYATLRQLSFAFVDLAWHAQNISAVDNVTQWEEEFIGSTSLFPKVEGTNISCAFSHIFNGGYSAGYYSYKWAEVLDADAFEYFKEKGIFNNDVANKFRNFILAKGGTEHPMELYKKFRGQEPSLQSLLKRGGLTL